MSTYSPIASVTLTSAQSSVTFSGIPQTYTDLVLVIAGRTTRSADQNDGSMRFNSDSNSNYSNTSLYGTGSTAGSDRLSNQTAARFAYWFPAANAASGIFSATTVHIMNYANTTTNKTILTRQSNQSNVTGLPGANVSLWRSTAAINTIEIFPHESHSWASGSTFNLYGVANASITNTAKATGGDSITTDGTYWYHTFRTSGTFTPTQALTCDYLVVAGGGGGSGWDFACGGGGAGGLRCTVTATGGGGSLESALSLTANTNYTVTVGAGGAGNTVNNADGANGSNSVFATITSTGGGGGGASNNGDSSGLSGGSGGGGGNSTGGANGGAGTANQGYAGGTVVTGLGVQKYPGAGGGGAGAAGSGPATTAAGGAGGNGVTTSISGTSTTYAGGGGGGVYAQYGGGATGGTGGTGGGGTGGIGVSTAGSNGTANTGGGGGGHGSGSNGYNGGSGIVIVRYAV